VSLQPHYNLVHRQEFEQEMAEVVSAYGIGVIPYSPMAGGFLTGKYLPDRPLPGGPRAGRIQARYMTERNFQLLHEMAEIGRRHSRSVGQVALAWIMSKPHVTAPIVGANSVEQLRTNLAASGLRLEGGEVEALDALSAWREP
jgi:aryl-alcohol dehydrogenase-like predicted oxidoreductase